MPAGVAWSGPSSCAKRRKALADAEDATSSLDRIDAKRFCAKPNDSSLMAALGIFSLEGHSRYRREIRATWMRHAQAANIVARFVLHGLGVRQSELEEASTHGDITFLRAPAVMSCKAGALHKLILWLECAMAAWPKAAMIGKADDDAWIHLPGVAAHVTRSLSALGWLNAPPPPCGGLVWGSMESYHWHEGIHRPVGFMGMRYAYRRLEGNGLLERCRQRGAPRLLALPRRDVPRTWLSGDKDSDDGGSWNGAGGGAPANVTGPFFFAKGPLYLISRTLIRQLLAHPWVRAEAAAAISSGEVEAELLELTWPWEDVFLGAALARAVTCVDGASRTTAEPTDATPPSSHAPATSSMRAGRGASTQASPLAAVHVGATATAGVFSEEWGIKAAPATLVWHMRTKVPERIRTMEEWASHRPRCNLLFERMAYCRTYRACSGALWRACEPAHTRRRDNCSVRLEDVAAWKRQRPVAVA